MGLEYFYSTFAADVAAVVDVVTSPEEEVRRLNAQVRVKFYYDDYKDLLNRLISEVFRETEVVNRLRPFVQLVGGTSFLQPFPVTTGGRMGPDNRFLVETGSEAGQRVLAMLPSGVATAADLDAAAATARVTFTPPLVPEGGPGPSMIEKVTGPSFVESVTVKLYWPEALKTVPATTDAVPVPPSVSEAPA